MIKDTKKSDNHRVTATSIWEDLDSIKKQAPLIHNITNYVVMEFNANVLLALGASPVMAHALEEVEAMCAIAKSLVVNIGTLSKPWIESMDKAFATANQRKIPTVLDPVGAGATHYRTNVAKHFINHWHPTVIRGNPSEILAISSSTRKTITKGVDSTLSPEAAIDSAKILSKETGSVIVISGEIDYIIHNDNTLSILNGCHLMPKIVGMGCSVSATVGSFLSINNNPLQAATHAMALFSIAGEMAAKQSQSPGSYKVHFIDALYNIKASDIKTYLKINQ